MLEGTGASGEGGAAAGPEAQEGGLGALGAQGSLRDPLWAWLSTRSTTGAGLLACRGAGSLSTSSGRSGEGRRCSPPLGAKCRVLPCAAVLYFMFERSLFLLLPEKQKQLGEN